MTKSKDIIQKDRETARRNSRARSTRGQAIPFSLALRLRRICSTNAKFKHRINELKTYLLARAYNNNFLEEEFLRAVNISRTNALHTKPKDSNDVVPFVVRCNPAHVTPLTVAETSLSNHLLLFTDVALVFVTF